MAKNLRAELMSRASAIWRYRWITYAISVAICLFGWTLVMMMPNQYESEGRVIIDESVLSALFKSTAIEPDLKAELASLQKTLISRPNMEKVAEMTGANLAFTSEAQANSYYTKLETKIKVTASASSPIIAIAYGDTDPVMTRDVIRAVITILLKHNSDETDLNMQNATEFLDEQIRYYEQRLKLMDEKVAAFKKEHVEELAGGGTYNQRMDTAEINMNTAKLAVADSEGKLQSLSQVLAGTPAFFDVESAPQLLMTGGGTSVKEDPMASRIYDLEKTLDSLKLRYTDKHPDVVSTQKLLDDLRAQSVKMKEDAAKKPPEEAKPQVRGKNQVPNPLYENINMRVLDAKQELEQNRRRYEQAQINFAKMQGLAVTAPKVEAEYGDLIREYATQKNQYDILTTKRETARMSKMMGKSTQKVQLRVLDEPRLPTSPSGPQRVAFVIVVLSLSLVLGVIVSVGIHFVQGPVTSVEALSEKFDYPTLGEVMRVVFPEEIQRLRRQQLHYFAALGVLLVLFFGAIIVAKKRSAPKIEPVPLQKPAAYLLPVAPAVAAGSVAVTLGEEIWWLPSLPPAVRAAVSQQTDSLPPELYHVG